MSFSKNIGYMYAYNNGIRNRNVGFVKAEVRNDMLKININMKEAYFDGGNCFDVHVFFRRNGKICGIYLGSMNISEGCGEFRYVGLAEDIQNSGISSDKLSGVFLSRNKSIVKIFGAEWDDMVIDTDKIRFGDEWQDDKEDLVVYEIAEAVESQENTAVTVEQDLWEELYSNKEKVLLFAEDDIYDCIEIEPADIDRLPNVNWGLRNNSFLNHGYYSFRHLIVGRQHRQDGYEYIIGVPGIYTRRDKSMASMYGFEHFKFSMRSDITLSQFGYWYTTLKR